MAFHEFYKKEVLWLKAKGANIYCIVYIPKKNPSAEVMVVHHGFSEHSGRYANLIEALEELRYTIYLFDMRGHGRTDGKRGHANYQDLLDDLDLVINIALEREPAEKVILFGHSLGAVVSALYAENPEKQKKIKALVLSSLATEHKLNFINKLKKFIAPLFAKIVPETTVTTNVDPTVISHDPAVVQQYAKDKFNHGEISFALGNFFMNSEKRILADSKKLKIPLYMFHGKADPLIDYHGSQLFFENAGSKIKELKLYEGLYHETLNEYPLNRQMVENDLIAWLSSHIRKKIKKEKTNGTIKRNRR